MLAIYTPHRYYPHYLLLLMIPFCLVIAWPVLVRFPKRCDAAKGRGLGFVLAFVAVVATWHGSLWLLPRPADMETTPEKLRSVDGDYVRMNAKAGDRIVVWGWTVAPYLGSGRLAGTRDLNMANFLSPNAGVRGFYRERFLRDMKRNRPAMFIDATGENSFGDFVNRERTGFERFPEIRAYIEANYVKSAERFGERFYSRRPATDAARSAW